MTDRLIAWTVLLAILALPARIIWGATEDYRHPCIRSHKETVQHPGDILMMMPVGAVQVPIYGAPYTTETDVCDARAP